MPNSYSVDVGAFALAVVHFLVTYILPCVIIIVVAVVAIAVVKSIIRAVSNRWKSAGSPKAQSLTTMLMSLSKWVIIYFAVIEILGVFNVAGMLIAAVTGIFGVAIGFALQSFVKDSISGGTFLASDAFNVGDVVTAGGVTGKVMSLGISRTVLKDAKGNTHIIPNGAISVITRINITDANREDYLSDLNA